MTNARIQTVNPATEAEALAPRTTIHWNPTDNTGSVVFECAKFYRTAGTFDYFGAPEPDGAISVSLADLLQRSVDVPTPGGPINVPMPLLMGAIKVLFDELYNEQRGGA
jgi:hypothetical protein